MPVDTDDLRAAIPSLYPDNLNGEIDAARMREGQRLIADVIDEAIGKDYSDEAKAWAQSPTPPDPLDLTSKSAKTWAAAAKSDADTALIDADRAEAAALTIPLHVAQFVDLAGLVPADLAVGGFVYVMSTEERYQRVSTGGDLNYTGTGGIRLKRVYSASLDFKLVRPPAAPGLSLGSAGALTGIYYYRVTYVTDEGNESGAGTISGAITPAAQQINVTVPVSTDLRVVARRIYRTVANPGSLTFRPQLVAEIADNTTTAYVDNVVDGSLGAALWWVDRTSVILEDKNVQIGGMIVGAIGPLATVMGHNAMPGGGYASTAIGANAMSANTTGARNTAVGHDAMTANTTGYNLTALGVHSLGGNTTGLSNVGVGYTALITNQTGSSNVAIGGSSAETLNGGNQNTAVGQGAMQLRTTGDDNVAVGYLAGRAGTGNGNIAIGRNTGTNLTTGAGNVAIGHLAAPGGGSSGVAIGTYAGQRLTTGGTNVLIGPYAGSWVTTEGNLLFVDAFARTDMADSLTKAMIYGVFGATVATQQIHLNARAHLNGGVSLPSVAVTGAYTVLATDYQVRVTGTASVTLTLPSAVTYAGKVLSIKNKAAFPVISASSNVVPLAGGAPGTAILPATAGAWVQLQAIANQWEIVQAGA